MADTDSSSGRSPPPAGLGSRCVLWIDEDEAFLSKVAGIAEPEGIEIARAHSPREALRTLRSRDISGAVINTQLASGNAFQLARMLRAVPGYESLPLAFASSDNVPEDHVASALTGARVILTRWPVPDVILGGVRDLIRARDSLRPKILLVEADEAFARETLALIRSQGWVGYHESDPAAVERKLEEVQADLLLLDMGTPGLGAVELCHTIRASPIWRDLPVIFLTSENDPETRLAVFRAGGDDYITRPIVPEELAARIQVRLDRARLLRERSDLDALSGLMLRRPFLELLRQQIAFAQRHKQPLTLCLLDIDGFRDLNDRFGRLAGDQVIATLGSVLKQTFRSEDLRCRWGGQEFMIAFLGSRPDVIEGVMAPLLREFGEVTFESEAGEEFDASFTVSVASIPEDGDSLRDLLKVAGERRFEGKQIGGGVVVGRQEEPGG